MDHGRVELNHSQGRKEIRPIDALVVNGGRRERKIP